MFEGEPDVTLIGEIRFVDGRVEVAGLPLELLLDRLADHKTEPVTIVIRGYFDGAKEHGSDK